MNGMFYIITGGEAKVFDRSQTSRAARDHHGVVVARLTPGDIFGHTALLPGSSGIRGAPSLRMSRCSCLIGDRCMLLGVVDCIPLATRPTNVLQL